MDDLSAFYLFKKLLLLEFLLIVVTIIFTLSFIYFVSPHSIIRVLSFIFLFSANTLNVGFILFLHSKRLTKYMAIGIDNNSRYAKLIITYLFSMFFIWLVLMR